jgi:hypothetical protein
MPKPSRRERRKLAEQGKFAPRRAAATTPASRPVSTSGSAAPSLPTSAEIIREETAVLADSNEYAYVKSDLVRIMVLASLLVAIMVVLKFTLPQ